MDLQEKAGDVFGEMTSKVTVASIGAAVGENLIEKAAFKGFPQAFGIAVTNNKGKTIIKPAKLQNGAWIPQTADSPRPFWMRQAARGVTAALAFGVAISSKDPVTRAAGGTFAVLALSHVLQDAMPPLRG